MIIITFTSTFYLGICALAANNAYTTPCTTVPFHKHFKFYILCGSTTTTCTTTTTTAVPVVTWVTAARVASNEK